MAGTLIRSGAYIHRSGERARWEGQHVERIGASVFGEGQQIVPPPLTRQVVKEGWQVQVWGRHTPWGGAVRTA